MNRFFPTIIRALLIGAMLMSTCSAENFQFVDAEGNTGYYVDMDSVEDESRNVIFARIAVKKAGANRMFVYDVRFNHAEKAYQIISSQTIDYETQNVLESKDEPRDFRAYAPNSEMSELLRFIMDGGDLPD